MFFFALKRCGYRFVRFKVYQRFDAVSLREAVRQSLAMLVNAPQQIVRNADIQRSAEPTGKNVYPIAHFEVDGLPGQARQ